MSDFTTLTSPQLKELSKHVFEKQFLNGKTVAEKMNDVPPMLKGTVQGKINETLEIYAAELEKSIKENKSQNPTMTQAQLAVEVEKDLEIALKKNTKFNALANEAKALGINVDIDKLGDATRQSLVTPPTSTGAPAAGRATTPTKPDAPAQDSGTKLQRYSKEDAIAVRTAAAAGVPFAFNQAAMDDLLDNTMVQNKRGRSDTKMDGGLGEMFKGMEPMMQRIMETLMMAFQSLSGNMNGGQSGNWADYGVMNSTSAAMSRVLNDIQGSGPGEGVFKDYKSARGFNDENLKEISIINGNVRKALASGDKKEIDHALAVQKHLDDENKAKFGMSSKEMWGEFERDKLALMETTVVAMAVEARKNGLVDTSIDGKRLIESYRSKGASERAAVDYETNVTVNAMHRGIIPMGDPRKITNEQKAIIEQEYDAGIFGSSPARGASQQPPAQHGNGDVELKPAPANLDVQIVAPATAPAPPAVQQQSSSTQAIPATGMTQSSNIFAGLNIPIPKLVGCYESTSSSATNTTACFPRGGISEKTSCFRL